MGLMLQGKGGQAVTVAEAEWYFLLVFAEQYGWKPAGTVSPRNLNPAVVWDGQYDLEAGQEVTDDDARAMARALRFALRDPFRGEIEAAVARHLSKVISKISGIPHEIALPDMAETIRSVVELCEGGSFLVGSGSDEA